MLSRETEITIIRVIPVTANSNIEVLGIAEGHDRDHSRDVALCIASTRNHSAQIKSDDAGTNLYFDGRLYGRVFFKRTKTWMVS